jgi:hypothetical protein
MLRLTVSISSLVFVLGVAFAACDPADGAEGEGEGDAGEGEGDAGEGEGDAGEGEGDAGEGEGDAGEGEGEPPPVGIFCDQFQQQSQNETCSATFATCEDGSTYVLNCSDSSNCSCTDTDSNAVVVMSGFTGTDLCLSASSEDINVVIAFVNDRCRWNLR